MAQKTTSNLQNSRITGAGAGAATTSGGVQFNPQIKKPQTFGQQRNSSSGPPSATPKRGQQGYEFDSFVSTEEAFFGGIEESKGAGGYGALRRLTDKLSNPQEDGTPTIARTRANFDSFHGACAGGSGAPKGFQVNRIGMLAKRQKTQRLSPKGVSMANNNIAVTQQDERMPQHDDQDDYHDQSFKFFDSFQNDDSHGSNKLKSVDQHQHQPSNNLKFRQQKPSKLKVVTKRESNIIVDTDTPSKWRHSSSMGNGNLMENYSSADDLEDDEHKSSSGGMMRHSISKRSFVSPPLDNGLLKKKGKSFRNLKKNETEISGEPYPANVPPLSTKKQLHNTESQRIISQPIHHHTGQASMKLDMKFGWRPTLDKDRLHRKEAIAIKLSYPHNPNLMRTSIRGNLNMLSELYRYTKNYRNLKGLTKKINEEDFPNRLVYQGYRPSVSLDLHIRYGQKGGYNEESQYYDVLIPKHIKQKAIDEGMGLNSKVPRSPVNQSVLATIEQAERPTCDISFDSMFESGNLDLALQVQAKEFNLYLRPDTNTKGYCNWFFFKVLRKAEGKLPRKKITINIMNMYKKKILFKHEAKPLACSQEIFFKGFVMQELENVQWKTNPFSNIGYGLVSSQVLTSTQSKPTRTEDDTLEAFKNQAITPNNGNMTYKKQKFFCLSFDFEFQSGQEFAYIAQSIPYPYTFLKKTIKTCARLDQAMTTLTRSLGGLQIPMLTITNEVVNISKKRTVIICGRVHPGETNSSWILHGIIDFLISKDASHLRDSLVFKIVPMVNPDGVVAGNYRTSFIGKDLNRLYLQGDAAESKYSNMDEILKPEISAMKQLIKGCKTDDSKGVLAFIDVHQHSQKRGAFMYGPSVSMHHSKYQEVRVLPKLISMMLPEMFRFQSCRFKNQSYKENCARLYCDREQGITFSFCLECSQQGYFTTDPEHGGRYVKYFDQNQLMFLGRKICEASHMLNEMVEAQDLKREAITKRRRIRNAKKATKKGCGKSTAGRSAAKGSKGEHNSMGGLDFDNESDGYRNLNHSESSQDMVQGGFNPKIGIKGFIATMMKKVPSKHALASDSSRGALRTKTNRPLTHFGSEDAVSEKSEKEEESLSEDGSNASSAQDLSDDDQALVLNQVLDELLPNRIKKIEPVTAQITVTKGLKVEPPIPKINRKILRSANRIFYIDKKLIQKEQLLMPKAVPDLQVYEGTATVTQSITAVGQTNFHVTSPPVDLKSSVVVPFGNDSGGLMIGGGHQLDLSDEKQNKNPVLAATAARTTAAAKRKGAIQGLNLPGMNNQGYVSQRQNKKRIQSSHQKKMPPVGKDIFANQNYVPPALKQRQQNHSANQQQVLSSSAGTTTYGATNATVLSSGNAATTSPAAHSKVQYNNLYSIAPTMASQPVSNSGAIVPQFKIVTVAGNIESPVGESTSFTHTAAATTASAVGHHYQHQNNRQQQLNQSFSQKKQDDITFRIPGAQINSAGITPSNRRALQAASMNSAQLMQHQQPSSNQTVQKISRNDINMNSSGGGGMAGASQVVSTQQLPDVADSKWSNKKNNNASSKAAAVVVSGSGTIPKTRNNGAAKTQQHSSSSAVKNNRRSVISKRRDEKSGVNKVSTVILTSKEFQPQQQPTQDKIDRTKVPLNQGGFFHRNQILHHHQTDEDQYMLGVGSSGGQSGHYGNQTQQQQQSSNQGVIIRHKPGVGAASAFANAKRNSAVVQQRSNATTKAINRISHKRQSQQQIAQYSAAEIAANKNNLPQTSANNNTDVANSYRLEQMTTSQFGMQYTNYSIVDGLRQLKRAAPQIAVGAAAQNSEMTLNSRLLNIEGAAGAAARQAISSGYFLRSPVRKSSQNLHLDSSTRHQYSKTQAKTQALISTNSSVISSSNKPQHPPKQQYQQQQQQSSQQKLAIPAANQQQQLNIQRKYQRQRTGKPRHMMTSYNHPTAAAAEAAVESSYRQPRVNIRATSAQKYNKIGHHQQNRLLDQQIQLSPYKQAWAALQMASNSNSVISSQLFRDYVENETRY